jgi:hypothetical protein
MEFACYPSLDGVSFNTNPIIWQADSISRIEGAPLVSGNGAIINVNQSAISSATLPGLYTRDYLLFTNISGAPPAGTYTASECTYMTATTNQSQAQLINITNQPNLLVNPPQPMGLLREIYPAYGNDAQYQYPLLDGPLIDCIANADTVNQLINPQDSSIITVDVFGNPRVDNNGRRNIGAIQNMLAPFLSVQNNGTDSGTILLSWVPPLQPANLSGFHLCYCPTSSQCNLSCSSTNLGSGQCPKWIDINNSMALSTTVSGLQNGNEYSFCVSGVKNGTYGPSSNVVAATPYGRLTAPKVTSTGAPGCNSLKVSWTEPSLGGYALLEYGIVYFPATNPGWSSTLEATSQSITIGGPLLANTEYTVCVLAVALGNNGVVYGDPGCLNITTSCTVRAP